MRYPILLCQIVLILIQFGRCEKYEREAYGGDYEEVNGYSVNSSQRIKRADEKKVQLLSKIDVRWCKDDECNYGNMMADAIVFYARWKLKWKTVPIGIFYQKQCKTKCTPELKPGNYSTDAFLKPFASFDDDLYDCESTGKNIANMFKRFEPERKSMKRIHASNLHVITTKEKDEWYITARCLRCYYGEYEQLRQGERRPVITNSYAATQLGCNEYVKGTTKDALKFYIETKKVIYPTVESRYWELTKRDIMLIKEGNRLTDSASGIVCLKIILFFQFFMLHIV